MRCFRFFALWAAFAFLGGRWGVSARPRWSVDLTWLGGTAAPVTGEHGHHDDTLASSSWSPVPPGPLGRLAAPPFDNVPVAVAVDRADAADAGGRPCEVHLAAVDVAAAVCHPDPAATPTATPGTAPAVHVDLQRRDEGLEAIPSSVKAGEQTIPPNSHPTPLPLIVDCGGLSSCPKGYSTVWTLMTCYCRLNGS